MARNWDRYSRQGVDLAFSATSFGFSAAKIGTRLGFSIARGIATTAVGATTTAVDLTLFGGSTVTRPVFGLAVSTVLTIAEQITLAPIHLSEYITSTSLLAAHSSINVLSVIFPGSSDASFSLASFIDLVRREWGPNAVGGSLPDKQFGITQIARAIVAWCSLQGVTQEWQEKRWFKYVREIDVKEPPKNYRSLGRKTSRIRVTSDIIFPGPQASQIIAADIGEPEPALMHTRATSSYIHRTKSKSSLSMIRSRQACPIQPSVIELKSTLRRLSKMVLAGYGGASLLFFGVNPAACRTRPASSVAPTRKSRTPQASIIAHEKSTEEMRLARAVDASEAEAAGDASDPPSGTGAPSEYSWWDLLLGKHDQEIFELSTVHPDEHTQEAKKKASNNSAKMKATAVIGNEHLMPRFWVLTDHGRGQIVLVIRGTMSLNELAVDLTCEPEPFEPASTPARGTDSDDDEEEMQLPGQFKFPSMAKKESQSLGGDGESSGEGTYHVHGGMLKMAKAMGDVGKPVHLAVLQALFTNPDFDLVLCGHSLGAGVAAMLGMMWADPKTCLTVRSSGLPAGRHVQVYCFAPPCLTDTALSRLTSKLIVSLVYSHDVVARLSLGAIRDLRNAAMWLCEAEAATKGEEGWSAVTARAKRWSDGKGKSKSPSTRTDMGMGPTEEDDDMQWFIAMRKTLEANMQNTSMYPPGRVLWSMRDSDLHPSHQRHKASATPDKLRVFEVLDVEKVFSQIVFSRNMLSAHMPHQYDEVIHDLL